MVDLLDIVSKIHYANNRWIILLPAIAALFDVLTGFIQAQINGTKNSSVMRKGLYRKAAELLLILFVMVVCLALSFPIQVAAVVSFYVVWMESLSIAENLKAAGVPIPAWITQKANEISNQIENGVNIKDKDND